MGEGVPQGRREGYKTPHDLRIERFKALKKLFEFSVDFDDVLRNGRYPEEVLVRHVLIYAAKMAGKDEEHTTNGYLKRIFKKDQTTIGNALTRMTEMLTHAKKQPARYEKFLCFVEAAVSLEQTGAIPKELLARIQAFPQRGFDVTHDIPSELLKE